MKKTLPILLLLCLVCNRMAAQQTDISPATPQSGDIRNTYLNPVGEQAIIYSGRQQVNLYPQKIQGTAYYRQNDFQNGTLYYDGIIYTDIKLRLDTYTDELLTLSPNNRYSIYIEPKFFESARFKDYTIFYQKANDTVPFSGYYVQLYKNNYELIEKPKTILTESVNRTTVVSSFQDKGKFFLVKDGQYQAVKIKNSLFNIFKETKKELKSYANESGLDFKANPIHYMTEIIKKQEELEGKQ